MDERDNELLINRLEAHILVVLLQNYAMGVFKQPRDVEIYLMALDDVIEIIHEEMRED